MSLSDYTFREAVAADFDGIEQLFIRNDFWPRRPPGWTAWKYLQSPDGRARIFVGDDTNQSIVGMLAYMPRRFTSAKTGSFVAMCVVDIIVNPDVRKSGFFLRLLDYTRKRIDLPKIGVPNVRSAVFAKSPGWQVVGPYERWIFPVSAGALLAGKTLELVRPLSDLLLRGYAFWRLGRRPRNLEMRPVQRFQTGYVWNSQDTRRDTAPTDRIHGIRSAEYLNWRFAENPITHYFTYEFYDEGEPVGYCVYARSAASAVIFDFAATRRQKSCMYLLIDNCRKAGVTYVIFSGVGLGLKRLGFIRCGVAANCRKYKAPDGEWVISACDVDLELGEPSIASGDAGSASRRA